MNLYVGNLDAKVDEQLLYELMIQAAPVSKVYLPRDKVSQLHQGYGFVEFQTAESANYAQLVLDGTKLYGRPLKISAAGNSNALAAAAELFVGNLDQLVDEQMLQQTLGSFGTVKKATIVRDEAGVSRGHGFVTFSSFGEADAAIEGVHGQYILNKPCKVEYAIRDGKRRGQAAERRLAGS